MTNSTTNRRSKSSTKKTTKKKAAIKTNSVSNKELRRIVGVLEMVIDNVPQHIFWKDINFVFQGCNKNFAEALELNDPSEIVGKSDFDVSPEHAERFRKIDELIIQKGEPVLNMREEHIDANGEKKILTVNKLPLKDDDGNIVGILGTCEDVTLEVTLEEKIKRSEEKYRGLIEFTNTAYVIMDTKLNILDANDIFLKLFGFKKIKEVIDKKLRSWVMCKQMEDFDVAIDRMLKGKRIDDKEIHFVTDTDKIIYAAISANIVQNGEEKIMCLIRNVSHRKTEEEQKYIESQKEKDKIRQNIFKIRSSLKRLNHLGDEE